MEALSNVTVYAMSRDGHQADNPIALPSWHILPLAYCAAAAAILLLLVLSRLTLLRCYKGEHWWKILGVSAAVCVLACLGGLVIHRRTVNVSMSSALGFSWEKAAYLCEFQMTTPK